MKNIAKKALLCAATTALASSMAACGTAPVAYGPQFAGPQMMQRSPMMMQQRARFGRMSAPSSGKKWTIAIHLAADNNLYSAGLDDINEMEAGLAKNPAAAEALDIIVLFDGLPKGDSKIYRIKPDSNGYDRNIISEVIDDQNAVIPPSGEVDSGDPEVFKRFVDYVTTHHNAEYNSISIWNHGSGIYRGGQGQDGIGQSSTFFDSIGGTVPTRGASSKSFASDDHGGEMQLRHLNPALDLANKNLGRPLDIFGFDTCLMQYLETAYQIKGQANILVASEELEPGDGWDYEAYIGSLAQNPAQNPVDVSRMMIDTYGISYRPGGSQRGRDITLSAIDINALTNELTPALSNLGETLMAALPAEKAAIDKARNATQSFYNRDSADLGDFLKHLNANTRNGQISAAAGRVQAALSATVLNETHYGRDVERATGTQVYFPRSNQRFNKRYDDPKDILFGETRAWGNFLKAFTSR